MGLMSSKIEMAKLRPGDHIYTWRRGYFYSHHGIYVGDGMVIHLTRGPGLIIFSSSESEQSNDHVVCCNIEDFLSDGKLYRFEYGVKRFYFLMHRPGTCTLTSGSPPEQVLHRASYLLEHGFGNYNLINKNCEDFAVYCKTGRKLFSGLGSSGQIECILVVLQSVVLIPYHLLTSSYIVAVLVFCGAYSLTRIYVDGANITCSLENLNHLSDAHDVRGMVNSLENLNHLSDAHDVRGMVNYVRGMVMEKFSTRWFLSFHNYVYMAVWLIRIWYWTPENRILAWYHSYIYYFALSRFVRDHLRLHGLKLGEYSAYTIFVLGYWCWRSKSTICLCTRLCCLIVFLKSVISDHPTSSKALDIISFATIMLGFWHWTPGNTVLL